MAIPEKYKGKYFLHFTHLENLDSIVKHGLLTTNLKKEKGITHFDIASEGIQERRSQMDVTCDPKGKVHDYAPFYLCPINPMLLSVINTKNVDQQFIIFLAVSIDKIVDDSVIFTDASANTEVPPNFYTNPDDLDKLDWEAINKKKWGNKDKDEMHRRMAEVLMHRTVSIDKIDCIVVWNESIKKQVEKIFEDNGIEAPRITCSPLDGTYHLYFTKFMVGEDGSSLITGPFYLKKKFEKTIEKVKENRESLGPKHEFKFESLSEALNEISKDFCVIKELKGIYELETLNEIHTDNVSDHTLNVVKALEKKEYYQGAKEKDQEILKISAFLHDIGKGPKSKWAGGKQPPYPDHPSDSLSMVKRFLIEDVRDLSDYAIRKICLLVAYHDLIGEIFEKGRDRQQLINIVRSEKELDMLIALNYADVTAISLFWKWKFERNIEKFRGEILEQIESK